MAVVELGAGKGYLGGTLAACGGVGRLVATDIVAGLRLKVGACGAVVRGAG